MANGGQALKVQDENHQIFGSRRCYDRDLNGVNVNPRNTEYKKKSLASTNREQTKVFEVNKI